MRATMAAVALLVPGLAAAQPGADLVITNARIIVGTGAVIDRGSVVVTDGQITSVTAGATDTDAETRIDASGLTVLPGLIRPDGPAGADRYTPPLADQSGARQ